MQKFENVDVIAALGEIVRQNTAFYQSDFDIDKGLIQRAAASDQAVDRRISWWRSHRTLTRWPPPRTMTGSLPCCPINLCVLPG